MTRQLLSVQKKKSHSSQKMRRLLMLQRPMHLELVFFTDVSCHKTVTGLIPHATLSRRLSPIHPPQVSRNWKSTVPTRTLYSNSCTILCGRGVEGGGNDKGKGRRRIESNTVCFFFCLTEKRWSNVPPDALPVLRRTPRVGES